MTLLFELVLFNSIIFWAICLPFLFWCYYFLGEEDYYGTIPLIILTIFLVSFTNVPTVVSSLSWLWVLNYLIVGIVWWFSIFNLKLWKLRKYLRANNLTGESFKEHNLDSEHLYIYRTEPSFNTFCDRIICWPISILRFVLGDALEYAYNFVYDWTITYKKKFLGI